MSSFYVRPIPLAALLALAWLTVGFDAVLIFLAVFAFAFGVRWFTAWRHAWLGGRPHPVPLIYLEPRMAVRPTVLSHPVPEGYRLSCLFFGCGLIDRTRTLDHGFPYEVLDPIPAVRQATQPSLDALCDERARHLVDRATGEGRAIRLFWSGGIDSTAACVALLRALRHDPEKLEIVYSPQSRGEYRRFFRETVRRHPRRRKISKISQALDDRALITSGEHGDQIFGSIKALGVPLNELAQPWEEAFPRLLRTQLASAGRANVVMSYLSPQFARCPVRLRTLFDLLWWLNFSMKWQTVSIRMLGTLDQSGFRKVQPHVDHFFRTDAFQRWALMNDGHRLPSDWKAYKQPLKAYIRDFTGDAHYYETKEKEPSLRNMPRAGRGRLTLAVDGGLRYLLEPFDDRLRGQSTADSGATFSITVGVEGSEVTVGASDADRERAPADFEPRREDPLWDAMSNGE